jgi:hypothetical protein
VASDATTATIRRSDIKDGELQDCPLHIADMAEARLVLTDKLIDAALGRAEVPKPKGQKGGAAKAAPQQQPDKPPPRKPDRRRQPLE